MVGTKKIPESSPKRVSFANPSDTSYEIGSAASTSGATAPTDVDLSRGLTKKQKTKKSDKNSANIAEATKANGAAEVVKVEEPMAEEANNDSAAEHVSLAKASSASTSQGKVDEDMFKDLRKKKTKRSEKQVAKIDEPVGAEAGPDEPVKVDKVEEYTEGEIANESLAEPSTLDPPASAQDKSDVDIKDLRKKKRTKKSEKKVAKIDEPVRAEAGPDEPVRVDEVEDHTGGEFANESLAEPSSPDPPASTQDKSDEDMFQDLTKKKTKKSEKKAAKIAEPAEAEAGLNHAANGYWVGQSAGAQNAVDSPVEPASAPTHEKIDEVTDLFKGLVKKRKTKKPEKKTSKVALAAETEAGPDSSVGIEETGGDPEKGTGIWNHNATADLKYDQLLERFFQTLSLKHPDMMSGITKSYKIPPPQCLREGNKKTIFANISDICKRMMRSEEHATSYLFAELGTSGSVDGSRRLIIKGRFQQKVRTISSLVPLTPFPPHPRSFTQKANSHPPNAAN